VYVKFKKEEVYKMWMKKYLLMILLSRMLTKP
jgi:hypothetical protein